MDRENVDDEEMLSRALKPNPNFWHNKDNRLTSAVFMDKRGLSVDRDGDRESKDAVEAILAKFEGLDGVVRVKTSFAREIGCRVNADPIEENEYHAQILDDVDCTISKKRRRELASRCKFISKDDL